MTDGADTGRGDVEQAVRSVLESDGFTVLNWQIAADGYISFQVIVPDDDEVEDLYHIGLYADGVSAYSDDPISLRASDITRGALAYAALTNDRADVKETE